MCDLHLIVRDGCSGFRHFSNFSQQEDGRMLLPLYEHFLEHAQSTFV
jgi:hypothetical protein